MHDVDRKPVCHVDVRSPSPPHCARNSPKHPLNAESILQLCKGHPTRSKNCIFSGQDVRRPSPLPSTLINEDSDITRPHYYRVSNRVSPSMLSGRRGAKFDPRRDKNSATTSYITAPEGPLLRIQRFCVHHVCGHFSIYARRRDPGGSVFPAGLDAVAVLLTLRTHACQWRHHLDPCSRSRDLPLREDAAN